MLDPKYEQQLRQAIDPVNAQVLGTASYERRVLLQEIERLRLQVQLMSPMSLPLCASQRLVLQVGRAYVFTAERDCGMCQQMLAQAEEAYGPTGGRPQ